MTATKSSNDHTGSLSDDEFDQLTALLRRFCGYDLDQWETWKVETTSGTVYVDISRKPAVGASGSGYNALPGPVVGPPRQESPPIT